jgi:hypothetical protein
MLIAKIENGAVAKVADYREMFPNVSFPPNGPDADFLAANGCMGVTVWKAHDKTQKLVPAAPYIEGNTVYTVAVEAKTPEEVAADTASEAANVRAQRNEKLAQTDWTQGKDIPENISSKWAAYRQALRDVPAQAGFPWTVQWPNDPNWVAPE